MFVSVLIPTKEEPGIAALVNEVGKTLKLIKHEIIVIDKSIKAPKLNRARVIVQKSVGLGNAIVEGLKEAGGDVIVIMDGDGSHDPKDIPKLLKKIPEYDIVIGSKLVSGGKTEYSLPRQIVTLFFNSFSRMFLGIRVRDIMSGFAAIKRSTIEGIRLKPRGYKIVLEIVYKSRGKTCEVPIVFRKRMWGESKVGFNIDGLREVGRIFGLLWDLRFGEN